ncbi:hypothetical protein [Amaricoccus sp.]|uniref:hypothetical protein n=1 Tax=Amaricoccus sp. TaxID=1872485 RepID=UPI001B6AC6CA|nr:hypothetical protein [Amaricoccus sp.]MBP7003158.1 hypothetical protein [Amaricoccus sp.]
MAILAAGARYFAAVFAAGFALGAIRVGLIAPRLGPTAATLAEIPPMLAWSWFVCGWALRGLGPAPTRGQRVATGATALLLLLAAEASLAAAVGPGVPGWIAGMATPAGALGLAAQLAFAAMPLWRRVSS